MGRTEFRSIDEDRYSGARCLIKGIWILFYILMLSLGLSLEGLDLIEFLKRNTLTNLRRMDCGEEQRLGASKGLQ